MEEFKNLYYVEAFLNNNKGSRLGEAMRDIWEIIVSEGLGEEKSVALFAKLYNLTKQLLG